MTIKDGGPAFPIKGYCADAFGALSGEVIVNSGMSLRDYFAAKAMQVLVADYWAGVTAGRHKSDAGWKDGLSYDAYKMADAMLAAREVTP